MYIHIFILCICKYTKKVFKVLKNRPLLAKKEKGKKHLSLSRIFNLKLKGFIFS